MTLLVCSLCHTSLPVDESECPRCGPSGRAGAAGADASRGDPDVIRRLAAALGATYEVTRLLGRGGFAEVYEVYDLDLQRRLAIKVLRPDISWTGGMLARFKQEARAIARLNHPNTVPIHFVSEGEGLVFYAMPFVDARSLAELIRAEGPLTPARVTAIAAPILDALEYAHQHGLVHRDIKPANIVVETASGRPLLVDFGIAKSLDDQSPHHTQTGFVVGTPLYMSPEQALGQLNVDGRADIYAMGAVLFQMLTGSPPFEGQTSQEIVGKHLAAPVPVVSRRDPRVPEWLSQVIARCMAKQPAQRFQTAAEVRDALLAAGHRSGGTAAVVTEAFADEDQPTLVMQRAGVRGRWTWPVAGLLALALAVSGGSWIARPAAGVVFENGLLEPVALSAGRVERMIAPGDTLRLPVARGAALDVEWRLVRPRSGAGRELGVPLGGTLHEDAPRGVARHRFDLASLGRTFIAPVVTNMTGDPLRVTFRDERGMALECDCAIAPRSTRRLGYYDPARLSALDFA
ncbi:MAG: serine/threonine protein kinase, partial [Gemmatimonadales bacterium]|nr:serine/threonine protein kinase [Gemmatimonadales bacterium]